MNNTAATQTTARTVADLTPITLTAERAATYAFEHVAGLPAYADADLETISAQAAKLLGGMIRRGLFIIEG